jgi:hypothetical protein
LEQEQQKLNQTQTVDVIKAERAKQKLASKKK